MSEKRSLDMHASITEALGSELSLSDLEAVRLILRGNSIIDWNRANFRSLDEADRFLRLHLFNVSNVLPPPGGGLFIFFIFMLYFFGFLV